MALNLTFTLVDLTNNHANVHFSFPFGMHLHKGLCMQTRTHTHSFTLPFNLFGWFLYGWFICRTEVSILYTVCIQYNCILNYPDVQM